MRTTVHRPQARTRLPVVVAGVACLAALVGCADAPAEPTPQSGGAAVVRGTDDGYAGTALDRPFAKPAGAFTDDAGRRFDWAATRPVSIVFFGYTHCPDVCNTVMADVAAALRRVPPEVRSKVDVVFVTTDPARDTGPVMRRWLEAFDPAFVGVTAPPATIAAAAESLGVALSGRRQLPGGGYEVDHGTPLIGFQGDRGLVVWTEGTPVGGLRQDIERLAAS